MRDRGAPARSCELACGAPCRLLQVLKPRRVVQWPLPMRGTAGGCHVGRVSSGSVPPPCYYYRSCSFSTACAATACGRPVPPALGGRLVYSRRADPPHETTAAGRPPAGEPPGLAAAPLTPAGERRRAREQDVRAGQRRRARLHRHGQHRRPHQADVHACGRQDAVEHCVDGHAVPARTNARGWLGAERAQRVRAGGPPAITAAAAAPHAGPRR